MSDIFKALFQRRQCLAALGGLGAAMFAAPKLVKAQTAPNNAQVIPAVRGKTLSGEVFDLQQHRGRIVVLVFWTSNCAPCRQMMPDLREKSKTWMGRPYTTVLVNADKKSQDVETYNKLIASILSPGERLMQLWALDAAYQDNLGTVETIKDDIPTDWPLIYVINKQGQVIARHQMSMDAASWQQVVSLL